MYSGPKTTKAADSTAAFTHPGCPQSAQVFPLLLSNIN